MKTYVRGKSTRGGIFNTSPKDNSGSWIAVTCGTSKSFKTLKGAEKYMNKMEYSEIDLKERLG